MAKELCFYSYLSVKNKFYRSDDRTADTGFYYISNEKLSKMGLDPLGTSNSDYGV